MTTPTPSDSTGSTPTFGDLRAAHNQFVKAEMMAEESIRVKVSKKLAAADKMAEALEYIIPYGATDKSIKAGMEALKAWKDLE